MEEDFSDEYSPILFHTRRISENYTRNAQGKNELSRPGAQIDEEHRKKYKVYHRRDGRQAIFYTTV